MNHKIELIDRYKISYIMVSNTKRVRTSDRVIHSSEQPDYSQLITEQLFWMI